MFQILSLLLFPPRFPTTDDKVLSDLSVELSAEAEPGLHFLQEAVKDENADQRSTLDLVHGPLQARQADGCDRLVPGRQRLRHCRELEKHRRHSLHGRRSLDRSRRGSGGGNEQGSGEAAGTADEADREVQ